MKTYLLLWPLLVIAAGLSTVCASESKPVWKWVSANEYYMILPAAQTLDISGGASESVRSWFFGFRAVGHETFSRTGGLQFQDVKHHGEAVANLKEIVALGETAWLELQKRSGPAPAGRNSPGI